MFTKQAAMPAWLDNFIHTYHSLSANDLTGLNNLYHLNVSFQDPLHKLEGLSALTDYFAELYQNVPYCQFVITEVLHEDDQAAIYWKMSYQHKKLNKGKMIIVEGHSLIKGQEDKVVYHRDYLDVGQMLYEQLPLLGRVIRYIKTRASQ